MDRSFLSSDELIAISRDFVCIRTATYEDAGEARFLEKIFPDRSGAGLRNFGYCILDPSGEKVLKTAKRGPNFVYKDSDAMAADLKTIAGRFKVKKSSGKEYPPVPAMKNVRLGINVASCDGLPCVVVYGKSKAQVNEINKKLSQVIWDEKLAGKFIYASTNNKKDLQDVTSFDGESAVLVIKPDEFGLKGRVIATIANGSSVENFRKRLIDSADNYKRIAKEHGAHVRAGRRNGQAWKTEVKVPDRVRGRSQNGFQKRNPRRNR